jgi:hypothetical protein
MRPRRRHHRVGEAGECSGELRVAGVDDARAGRQSTVDRLAVVG